MADHDLFTPGERCGTSGIYAVRHRRHRITDYVTVLAGDTFPRCRICGDAVRFVLFRGADDIHSHTELDFPDDRRHRKAS